MSVKQAQALRKRATTAEKILWSRLRDRQLANLKFRRQHPIGSRTVDFFCDEARLPSSSMVPVIDVISVKLDLDKEIELYEQRGSNSPFSQPCGFVEHRWCFERDYLRHRSGKIVVAAAEIEKLVVAMKRSARGPHLSPLPEGEEVIARLALGCRWLASWETVKPGNGNFFKKSIDTLLPSCVKTGRSPRTKERNKRAVSPEIFEIQKIK